VQFFATAAGSQRRPSISPSGSAVWNWPRGIARSISRCYSFADAPPPGIENDFYNTAATDGSGILIGENLAERFFKALDIPSGPGNREDCLAEFQRRGYFLAFSVECPSDAAGPLVKRLGPVVVKRIQLSYKPRFIVLLSSNTQPMIRVLQEAGLGKRLILRNGSAVNWPLASDSSALAKESAVLRSLLAEIQEHTKAD